MGNTLSSTPSASRHSFRDLFRKKTLSQQDLQSVRNGLDYDSQENKELTDSEIKTVCNLLQKHCGTLPEKLDPDSFYDVLQKINFFDTEYYYHLNSNLGAITHTFHNHQQPSILRRSGSRKSSIAASNSLDNISEIDVKRKISDEIFKEFDQDGSFYVELTELIIGLIFYCFHKENKINQLLFKRYDLDKNGSITIEELWTMLQTTATIECKIQKHLFIDSLMPFYSKEESKTEIVKAIEDFVEYRLDLFVNSNEVSAYVFSLLDTNYNGQISESEFSKMNLPSTRHSITLFVDGLMKSKKIQFDERLKELQRLDLS